MFHIFLIGYTYVVFMFSLAQASIERGLVYFLFFGGLPILFVLWVRGQRSRNRQTKQAMQIQENTEQEEKKVGDL